MEYRIIELPPFTVAGLKRPSAEVSELWRRCGADGTLEQWSAAGDAPWTLELFWGGSFEEGGVSMLGVVCSGGMPPGTEVYRCPSCSWLCAKAEGPLSVLEDVWRELNGGFLPRNGLRLREGLPKIEVYRVREADRCLVDILLPLV